MDRKARSDLHQRRSRIKRHSESSEAVEFFNILTSEELRQSTQALLPEHRERLYPPMVTRPYSCARRWRSTHRARGPSTAGRRSVPLTACVLAACAPARIAGSVGACHSRWPVRLHATRAACSARRRARNGCGSGEWSSWWTALGCPCPTRLRTKPRIPSPARMPRGTGVGSPLARLVTVVCLGHRCSAGRPSGHIAAKGRGELGLVRQVLGSLRPGDVLLADAL